MLAAALPAPPQTLSLPLESGQMEVVDLGMVGEAVPEDGLWVTCANHKQEPPPEFRFVRSGMCAACIQARRKAMLRDAAQTPSHRTA